MAMTKNAFIHTSSKTISMAVVYLTDDREPQGQVLHYLAVNLPSGA